VHQHLVDNDLEEQRRDEGEELDEERGKQDLAEQLAVFDDGRDEPAEVELSGIPGQQGPAGDQYQLAIPGLLKRVPLKGRGTLGLGVLHQDTVFLDLGQDEIVTVPVLGDGRQRELLEPQPVGLGGAGLELEALQGAKHVARRAGLAGTPKQVFEVCRVDREAQKPGHERHADETGLVRGRCHSWV